MEQSIVIFLLCIGFILIFGRILIWPIKKIIKLVTNSFLGGILLWVINFVGGAFWGFYIGVNIWTLLVVGFLGVPGAIMLIFIKVFILNGVAV